LQLAFATWREIPGDPGERFPEEVEAAARAQGVKRICEIGAGANPMLPLARLEEAQIDEYVVTDISERELAKAPEGYTKVRADIRTPLPDRQGAFDLISSRYVAEHVEDAAAFHSSVLAMLKPGGRAMHFFPTLYEPAFVLNRVMPEALTSKALGRLQDNRDAAGKHAKFPARYRWCRGPTRRQLKRLEAVGFEIERYMAIFGHGYLHPLPRLDKAAGELAEFLCRRHAALFCSYAAVTLRRPSNP
jgi:SAM-dependent methyltransferase